MNRFNKEEEGLPSNAEPEGTPRGVKPGRPRFRRGTPTPSSLVAQLPALARLPLLRIARCMPSGTARGIACELSQTLRVNDIVSIVAACSFAASPHVTFPSTVVDTHVSARKRDFMAAGKFVTYLRVSTDRQGQSGLGLEAQRAAVQAHLNGGRWRILQEFVEVESGQNGERPELVKALRLCRLQGATLLVAKLDRLSRNVAFLANLMEAKVRFTAADMPEADETQLHIMSVFAQHEARLISNRTKAALAASKARGTVLGGRRVSAEKFMAIAETGRLESARVRAAKADAYATDVTGVIEDIRLSGISSLREIARALNEREISARRGGRWSATQVRRIQNRN